MIMTQLFICSNQQMFHLPDQMFDVREIDQPMFHIHTTQNVRYTRKNWPFSHTGRLVYQTKCTRKNHKAIFKNWFIKIYNFWLVYLRFGPVCWIPKTMSQYRTYGPAYGTLVGLIYFDIYAQIFLSEIMSLC